MANRECSTQDEAGAAAAAGDMIVWRAGCLVLRGSSSARLCNYSRADLHGDSRAYLHHDSRAYLHDDSRAILYDRSTVVLHDNSSAEDGLTGAPLRRDRPRILLGPLGSRDDSLGVSLPSDGSEPVVYAGCWRGRLSEFEARVDSVYPASRYGDEYRAAIATIRAVAAIPEEAT